MDLLLTTFIVFYFVVSYGLTSVQSSNNTGFTNSGGFRVNLHNLFDSIRNDNREKSEFYRSYLKQEAERQQQAFDKVQEQLLSPLRRKAPRSLNDGIGEKAAAFKREVRENQDGPGTCETSPPENACIDEVTGVIPRGQHRFHGRKCKILYCSPNLNTTKATVIECEDYTHMRNLPENFPDTEERMYLDICRYCKPISPPKYLDLMEPDSTTPLTEESEEVSTNAPSTRKN